MACKTYQISQLPHWMQTGQLHALHDAIAQAGGSLRLVGGAVRDWVRAGLLEQKNVHAETGLAFFDALPDELDLATTLLPNQVIEIAEKLELKAIPTGIDHGTVTIVLADKTPLEITTLREDVACDGRHATVTFGTDYAADANRRDFTMNALYVGFDGTLYDYVNGCDDARAGRVRFIGDARARIDEDALRILRFYRFIAQVDAEEIDENAHAACTEKVGFMSNLSAERIQKELMKLLAQNQISHALDAMSAAGIFVKLGIKNPFLKTLFLHGTTNPVLRLRLLLLRADASEVAAFCAHVKLSKKDQKYLTQLQPENLPCITGRVDEVAHKSFICLHGKALYADALCVRAAFENIALTSGAVLKYQQLAQAFIVPEFPVAAADLLAIGFAQNKQLGDALRALQVRWEQENYTPGREDLMADAKKILSS